MLIETHAGELRTALAGVKSCIRRRNNIPVLGCVLLADGGVTATDLDMEITIRFAAIKFTGSAAVPFHPLFRLVSALPAETDIRLQALDRKGSFGVHVTFDSGRYWLPSIAAEDFPSLRADGDLETAKLADGFNEALRACRNFVSTEDTRYYLNGLCFSKANTGKDVLVATDGHMMIVHDFPHGLDGNLILPRMAVDALRNLPQVTTLSWSDTRMEFKLPGATLRSKLIDGSFPDWSRVVPQIADGSPKLTFNPRKMKAVLRRMQIADTGWHGQSINITGNASGDLVVVTRECPDGEECAERLEGAWAENWSGLPDATWCCSAIYLSDVCKVHDQADELVLRAADSAAPAIIMPEKGRAMTLLMPMREKSDLGKSALLTPARPANDPAAAEVAA